MAALGKTADAPAFNAKLSDPGAAPITDAWDKLMALANAYRGSNPGKSIEQAFAAVYASNPSLARGLRIVA